MIEVLNATPASRKMFMRDSGPIPSGEHFAMKDYAETLRQVAAQGSDALYREEFTKAHRP